MQNIALINNSIIKWRLSAPDIQELPLLAASSKMRLLLWLANPGNPAISPHPEGTKGTCYNNIVYTVEKRESWGGGTTQKLHSKAEWSYNKHEGSTHMWITDDRKLHRLTNASSTHALCRCTNKSSKMQGSTDPCRMHWHKCLLKHC